MMTALARGGPGAASLRNIEVTVGKVHTKVEVEKVGMPPLFVAPARVMKELSAS